MTGQYGDGSRWMIFRLPSGRWRIVPPITGPRQEQSLPWTTADTFEAARAAFAAGRVVS